MRRIFSVLFCTAFGLIPSLGDGAQSSAVTSELSADEAMRAFAVVSSIKPYYEGPADKIVSDSARYSDALAKMKVVVAFYVEKHPDSQAVKETPQAEAENNDAAKNAK